jgi:hypothetical protein
MRPGRDDLRFLRDLAAAVLEAARVRPSERVGSSHPNTTGGTLIRPGGRGCYPAFWIRDFAMSVDCGLILPAELRHGVEGMARTQATTTRHVPGVSTIPAGAIADHVNFDGTPIFFPGTYASDEQGAPWGFQPPFDNPFWFIHAATALVGPALRAGRSADGSSDGPADGSESRPCRGRMWREEMERAFAVAPSDPATGLVVCTEANRGVSFGFMDTVVQTGALLFASLLRWQAARELGWPKIADEIARQLPVTFADSSGLLRASTGRSAQPDVWGSAFAVAIGAVTGATADQIGETLRDADRAGQLSWQGQIRHVLTIYDHRPTSAWECCVGDQPVNRYQNGAYWGTATGWVCEAIARVDEPAARRLAAAYLDYLRAEDFRRGDDFGAPWECVHPAGDYRQNPVYLTSVTCPLASFQRLGW